MRLFFHLLVVSLTCTSWAEEPAAHRLKGDGSHEQAGQPTVQPTLLVVAEKPLRLDFAEMPKEWKPKVLVHRVTGARRVPVAADPAELAAEGWRWQWTPPAARGPVRYEARFEGEPSRTVWIESRDPLWVRSTLEMLGKQFDWEARGLGPKERDALSARGLRVRDAASFREGDPVSLEMIPRQGGTARRRVLWNKDDPALVVWSPGPAAGDMQVHAPRWWVAPEALATDHGLIRLLDLFSEPPPKN